MARGTNPVLSEHMEQVYFVQWFRRQYPNRRIFAIPNGGGRSKAQAGMLKAEGVSPGVPDLFVPDGGIWVEMKKSTGGRLSPEQKDWRDYLTGLGYRWIVGAGWENARDLFLMVDGT